MENTARCPFCGESFTDLDAHLRGSLPSCVLVTKDTTESRRQAAWRTTPNGSLAPTPKPTARVSQADPEIEGVAGISYNVKR